MRDRLILASFLAAGLVSTVFTPIGDCDEVFNYWEPLHFLIYGTGLQTWEYAPQYALRSYSYIVLHAIFAYPLSLILQPNTVFYAHRFVLSGVMALVQTYFVRQTRLKLGNRIANTLWILLVFSSGMFLSSSSTLPQTLCMAAMFITLGAASTSALGDVMVISSLGTATLLFWPFLGVLCIPHGVEILLRGRLSLRGCILAGLTTGCIILGCSLGIDKVYYRQWLLPIVNIVLYNQVSSSGSGGADIYGVEPPSYYFINLFLNWNVVSLLFLALPGLLCIHRLFTYVSNISVDRSFYLSRIVPLFSSYLWVIIFQSMAHKEERFLFPAYPGIALGASIALALPYDLPWKPLRGIRRGIVWAIVSVYVAASLSRVYSQVHNFSAPLALFQEVSQLPHGSHVCISKEWYRFPSSFFLPPGGELLYLEGTGASLLPKRYQNTFDYVTEMNDRNEEEPSRYSSLSDCDYLVDFDLDGSLVQKLQAVNLTAKVVFSRGFLDAEASKSPWRALYIPFMSPLRTVFKKYYLLKLI